MKGIMEHIGSDGVFAEGFAPAVITALGEGYVESDEHGRCKVLDDIKDLSSLAKSAIDSKRAYIKLSESEFKRPDDSATDEVKAAYSKRLKTELGASDKIEDYTFGKPENFPKTMTWNEEGAKKWAEYFMNKGYPVTMAKEMIADMHAESIGIHNTKVEDDKVALAAEIKKITDVNQEPALIEMGRLACKYIEQFCSDEAKAAIAAGKDKEGNARKAMFDDPTNLEEWSKRGIPPSQVAHMAKVAKVTESATIKRVTVPVGSEKEQAEAAFVEKCNEKSPSLQAKAS